jgi:hypothetical protein
MAATVPLTSDACQAIADRYFAEGSRLVDLATEYWNRAKDTCLDDAQRSGARLAYGQTSARARSCFKRHDMQLDLIAREVGPRTGADDLVSIDLED